MRLFRCPDATAGTVTDPAAIPIPLGVVRLGASVGEWSTDAVIPSATCRLPNEGRVVGWHRDGFDLELLVCRPAPDAPLHYPVADRWGAVWRGRASADAGPLVLRAVWDAGYAWHRDGPDSGQYYNIWTWSGGPFAVSIGTEDDERLAIRACQGQGIPHEWEAHFTPNSAYLPNPNDFWRHPEHSRLLGVGLACPLPILSAGETFEIVFGVAWTDEDEPSGVASALATEMTPALLLAGCGRF